MPHPNDMTVLARLMMWARWIMTALTVIYCVGFVGLLYGLEFLAEDHQFLSTMMYAPPWVWLLPIIPLGFLAIFIYARLLIPLALCFPVMIFAFMDLRWHNHGRPLGPSFKVVTNNIGQDHNKSFRAFADLQKADIIALQDASASGRGPAFAKDYPDRYVAGKDQFILISKYPVRAADVLPMPDPVDPRQRVAAWFELDVDGRALLVFTVHMPTPRSQLMAMKSPSALLSMLGKSTGFSGQIHEENVRFFKNQQELARQIVKITRLAKAPFIVCGDFNVPTHGIIYHLYRDNWIEAFNVRGQGEGATFPGDAKLPAWLRLDNIYCSKTGLRPIHAEVEEGRPSQHRCMAATFEFTDASRR
ncbi:MAG: endonuclease/exonuclease/phosphatase family protein [Limisphaerales bacterium]